MFKVYFKKQYQAFLRRLFNALFARELQGIRSQLEELEAQKMDQGKTQVQIARALSGMHVGVAETPKGSWVVLGYTQNSKDFVKFYDLGKTNMNGLRQMIDSYRKSGLAVLVEHPFKDFPHSNRSNPR